MQFNKYTHTLYFTAEASRGFEYKCVKVASQLSTGGGEDIFRSPLISDFRQFPLISNVMVQYSTWHFRPYCGTAVYLKEASVWRSSLRRLPQEPGGTCLPSLGQSPGGTCTVRTTGPMEDETGVSDKIVFQTCLEHIPKKH